MIFYTIYCALYYSFLVLLFLSSVEHSWRVKWDVTYCWSEAKRKEKRTTFLVNYFTCLVTIGHILRSMCVMAIASIVDVGLERGWLQNKQPKLSVNKSKATPESGSGSGSPIGDEEGEGSHFINLTTTTPHEHGQ